MLIRALDEHVGEFTWRICNLSALEVHHAVDLRRVAHRAADPRSSMITRSVLSNFACSFAALIFACNSMKRARRSSFTGSGTGSGNAFAAAPSTGE